MTSVLYLVICWMHFWLRCILRFEKITKYKYSCIDCCSQYAFNLFKGTINITVRNAEWSPENVCRYCNWLCTPALSMLTSYWMFQVISCETLILYSMMLIAYFNCSKKFLSYFKNASEFCTLILKVYYVIINTLLKPNILFLPRNI